MSDCHGNVRAIARREWLIKWARRLACVILLAAISFGLTQLYGGWRKQHLGRQTAEFVVRGDYPSAMLVARRLLELDPQNLSACHAIAEMADKSGSADAINWRRKIAQMEPANPSSQLALAKTALRVGQLDLAEHVLEALPQAARAGVEYHQVAAADALAHKDFAGAEKHFAAAAQAAPGDAALALNLAILRLASADVKVAEEARQHLANLTANPAARIGALRALAAYALAHTGRAEAQKWASLSRSEPGATLADSLLYCEASAGTADADAAMAEAKERAARSPREAAEFITWSNRHDHAQAAADWAAQLPSAIRETQPVPLAVAESFSFLRDWARLHDFVAEKNWGDCEALRLAVESHALHRLSATDRASMQTETAWQAALKTAQPHPEQLLTIARLAEGWGYPTEAAEAWWAIANGNENTKQALLALQHFYLSTQDTRGLLRVAKRALELNPNDLVAANNCASFGLLLTSDSTARRLALRLHSEHPENHAFTATYAYALQTEDRGAEGLQLLETLREEELRTPAIAAYYVVMLTGNGKLERARAFLADAKRASLLPEEQQLLTAAKRKLLASTPDEGAKTIAGR